VRAADATAAAGSDLLDTTTARAVLYSTATTIASFGSLSLSGHRGIASMGTLLVAGMLIALGCNLIVLPALLALRARRRAAAARRVEAAAPAPSRAPAP
jgi:predicted RND superfamily exporter protein